MRYVSIKIANFNQGLHITGMCHAISIAHIESVIKTNPINAATVRLLPVFNLFLIACTIKIPPIDEDTIRSAVIINLSNSLLSFVVLFFRSKSQSPDLFPLSIRI